MGVTLSFASRLEKEFNGVRGKGKYKVIDPFQKAHYFFDDISFRVGLNTGDPKGDNKSWVVKAIIVIIDFTTDFLLGLQDIRKIKLFRHIPELVEDSDSGDETDDTTSVYGEEHVFPEQKIRAMGNLEWSEEERHQRARDAYDKEEIEEVDYNLVEAIPSEAFEEEKEIKLPVGIFGNESLQRSTR